MRVCILDCYTDEASGLGVMPYLGTYPRYCWSRLRQLHPDAQLRYLTIDDLRLHAKHDGKIPERAKERKTDITIYNLTKNAPDAMRILHDAELVVVVLGVHVPGKYLSAVPGVLTEVLPLVRALPGRKVLIGPAVFGSQLFGGRRSETADLSCFSEVDWDYLDINEYAQVGSAAVGADLVSQLGFEVIAELETGKGCDVGKCSFCLEPLKNKVSFRTVDDVLAEAKALYAQGVRHFRLGKQTCFYSYQGGDVNAIVSLLRGMREACPQLKTLHIDNVNPNRVVADRGAVVTKAIVQYCTPGNVAAFGVESFDLAVVKENRLNTVPAIAYKATKILNEHGAAKGVNGMPHFLPGINIIYGLKAESKETHAQNMLWLKRFLDEGLLLRRINIRQVAVFPGTGMAEVGTRFIRKNKAKYWSWRNQIRQEIDLPLLQRMLPVGHVMKDVRLEIYDGNTTFGRQWGTYPLVIGIKGRHELGRVVNVRVTKHMLRSITGEIIA